MGLEPVDHDPFAQPADNGSAATPSPSYRSATPEDSSALNRMVGAPVSDVQPQEPQKPSGEMPEFERNKSAKDRTISAMIPAYDALRAAERARERGEGSFLWNLFNPGSEQKQKEHRQLAAWQEGQYEALPDYLKVIRNVGLPAGISPMQGLVGLASSSSRPILTGIGSGAAIGAGLGYAGEPGSYEDRLWSALKAAGYGAALGGYGGLGAKGAQYYQARPQALPPDKYRQFPGEKPRSVTDVGVEPQLEAPRKQIAGPKEPATEGEGSKLVPVEGDPFAAQQQPLAAISEDAEAPSYRFQTAKGSTYEHFDDGTTIRNKALRNEQGHEGDEGVKPRSSKTFYVDPQGYEALSQVQNIPGQLVIGSNGKQAAVATKDGILPSSITDISHEPAVGLVPVEVLRGPEDSRRYHFGNEITSVEKSTQPEGSQPLAALGGDDEFGGPKTALPWQQRFDPKVYDEIADRLDKAYRENRFSWKVLDPGIEQMAIEDAIALRNQVYKLAALDNRATGRAAKTALKRRLKELSKDPLFEVAMGVDPNTLHRYHDKLLQTWHENYVAENGGEGPSETYHSITEPSTMGHGEARTAVEAGKPYEVSPDVVTAMREAVAPHLEHLPEGIRPGIVTKVEPHSDPRGVMVHFETPEGEEKSIGLRKDAFFGRRALFDPNTRTLLFSRINTAGDLNHLIGGESAHEGTHALFGLNEVPEVFDRLLSHAESPALRVMDMPLNQYLRYIGDPAYKQAPATPLREIYAEEYKGRPDLDQAMKSEAIAHLRELYYHDRFGRDPYTAGELQAKYGTAAEDLASFYDRKNEDRPVPGEPSIPKPVQQPVAQTETPAFRNWFGQSKVVDAEGKPLVVYHGTNKQFDAFDPKTIGSRTDDGWLGKGFYFTSDPSVTNSYGQIRMPVYLSAQKIYDMNGQDFSKVLKEHGGPEEFSNWLRENGYDGATMWSQYMVLHPTQIKSAIGNQGTFDPNDPRISYALSGEQPMAALSGFHHGPEQAVEAFPQNKGTPEQWRKVIESRPGWKDYVDWTGLDDFIAGKKSITKDDLLSYMRAHSADLDEKVLGGTWNEKQQRRFDSLNLERSQAREQVQALETALANGTLSANDRAIVARNLEAARGKFDDIEAQVNRLTESLPKYDAKFEAHKIPGGEPGSYREILIRDKSLEGREFSPEENAQLSAIETKLRDVERKYEAARLEGRQSDAADLGMDAMRLRREEDKIHESTKPKYTSKHFNDQEIAHIRFDDRQVPGYGKTLFGMEFQSDLHQKGRTEGYGPKSESEIADLRKRANERLRELKEAQERGASQGELDNLDLERAFAQDKLDDALNRAPNAPFKGDLWLELALKRSLRYAVEHGYDAISWARSDQIAKAVGADPESLKLQYDQKIPKFLDKYVKKWGAKVESGNVIGDVGATSQLRQRLQAASDNGSGIASAMLRELDRGADLRHLLAGLDSDGRRELREIAGDHLYDWQPKPNPIIRITPQMRESVLGGQAYARGGKVSQNRAPSTHPHARFIDGSWQVPDPKRPDRLMKVTS